jgi:hypothetical protein
MSHDRTHLESAAESAGDDWLERLLVEDATAHRDAYVTDDGFTARVMAAVPVPSAAPAWRKPAVAVLWGVGIVGLAVAMPGAMLDVGREAYRLLAAQPVSLSGIAGAAAAMVGLTWLAAAYTLRSTE